MKIFSMSEAVLMVVRLGSVATLSLMAARLMAASAQAAALVPSDLDQLDLGAKIVGPVGPEVETTFINAAGEGIGDLVSSVSCPFGFDSCLPPENPAGTTYTYIHVVTPGIDLPNDPPFPAPDTVLPLDDAEVFRLAFPATGFNGVAGYSFSEAEAALGSEHAPTVEKTKDGGLVWRIPTLADWSSGERITFFWQTSQNPSGPGGTYGLAGEDATGDEQSGTAAGPLPMLFRTSRVPEPSAIAPLLLLGAGLLSLGTLRR
ncbi:MAG: exosortase, PEP-CTERM interaction domain protein [Cyanobacteria bacterium J06626_6]